METFAYSLVVNLTNWGTDSPHGNLSGSINFTGDSFSQGGSFKGRKHLCHHSLRSADLTENREI